MRTKVGMRIGRLRIVLIALVGGIVLAANVSTCMAPSWGASAVLHPWRRPAPPEATLPHEDVELQGDGVVLRGWRFPALGERRGWIVYLHGFGDDRRGGEGIARRFGPLGFEVLAYDSRAHGRSDGDVCAYGVVEKRDLARILDARPADKRALPVVLIGGSLGGAVALQAAAVDRRISLVVALATFSDLRTVATERAPFFARRGQIERALKLAENEGGFAIDDASPVAAAPMIRCPVLLVHGAIDELTPPDHSRRIHAALTSEKELIIVPGVNHDDPVGDEAWSRIEVAVRKMLAVQQAETK